MSSKHTKHTIKQRGIDNYHITSKWLYLLIWQIGFNKGELLSRKKIWTYQATDIFQRHIPDLHAVPKFVAFPALVGATWHLLATSLLESSTDPRSMQLSPVGKIVISLPDSD